MYFRLEGLCGNYIGELSSGGCHILARAKNLSRPLKTFYRFNFVMSIKKVGVRVNETNLDCG